MGRFHGGPQATLLVAGIALAFGGAALFGIVAHTKTPFFERMGTAPPHPSHRNEPAPNVARSAEPPRAPPASVVAAAPHPALPEIVPPQSLSQLESVIVVLHPAAAKPGDGAPFEANFPHLPPREPPVPEAPHVVPGGEETQLAEKLPDIRSAELKVVGAKWAGTRPPRVEEAMAAEMKVADVKIVELAPAKPRVAKAKPGEPKRADPKPAEAKRVEPKRVEPTRAEPKVLEASRTKPKPPEPRVVVAKRVEPKPVDAVRAKPKPAIVPVKAVDTKRIEAKPAALRMVGVGVAEPGRAAVRRPAAEPRQVEAKQAEAKRVAEMKAAEARLAETKRAAEQVAAEAKLAETKREADRVAAEAKLAETRRAAEVVAMEARLAEAQRAIEIRAADAQLAEKKRAVESTLAEARMAEAKLAETRRAIDAARTSTRASVMPAVETRSLAGTGYTPCDNCGMVTSVVSRYLERGESAWEVRVNFAGGVSRLFTFPTHPGFARGERVRYEAGRLRRTG